MAGANILRSIVGAVAKEAPGLGGGVATRRAVANIGLDIPGGGRLSPEEALATLQRMGIKPVRATVSQSDTEPTLVIELDRAMRPDEAHEVSRLLQQEAIAQVDETGAGDLFGPGADKWKPFNGDYFIDGDGKRLTQQIMEAGDPEAIPGGAPPDPVMDHIDEILRGLGQQKPAMAGGGVVKKVAGAVMDSPAFQRWFSGSKVVDKAGAPLRLNHGSVERGLEQFDTSLVTKRGKGDEAGTYFTPDQMTAYGYTKSGDKTDPRRGQVYETYLNLQNPLDTTDAIKRYRKKGMSFGDAKREALKSLDRSVHDGIVFRGDSANPPEYVAFDPRQIKSTDNEGTFDPADPRIKKASGGIVKKIVGALMNASDDAPAKAMRLYHGRSFKEPIERLDPTISTDQLGIHLGDPETASRFATIRDTHKKKDAGARVIPLDVDLKNPIRLLDNKGTWRPEDVYEQLSQRGLVPWDKDKHTSLGYRSKGWVQEEDGTWGDYGDQMSELDAMLEVQDLIRDLGHDGVVYMNRFELPPDAQFRAAGYPRNRIMGLTDEEFKKKFPETTDSYIAFGNKQLKSPFGEGTGVGYADGGPVKMEKGGALLKLGKGLVDMLDFSGVAGKPRTVKIPDRGEFSALPIEEIDGAAEAYMKKHGIPGTHRIEAYPDFDEDFAKRIANEYDGAKHAPNDPAVRRSYDALLEETMEQYRALEDTGLDVRFLKDGMADPYKKSPSMGYADMVDNNRLWVFPTEQGYGSDAALDVSQNPLLKKVGRVGDKENAVANDAFRVVHDAYGHFGPGNPFFRRQGEDRAWQHHGRMFTDDALPAMSAETRGQNSWVNSGPHAAQNRGLSGGDTIYADQKATIMPPWVYERDLGRKPKFADGGPVDDDIMAYESLRDEVSRQPQDIQSMTHVGSKPRRPVTLETFGREIDLGDAPYDVASGMSGMAEGANMAARMGIYGVPVVGPFIGAGLDLTEAAVTEDPSSALMAAAFGPGGKLARAAGAGVASQGIAPEDAEGGVFGRAAKWALTGEGKDAFNEAIKMSVVHGADNSEIMAKTGWFKDVDGHWKFWRTSQGGGLDLTYPKSYNMPDVYSDPHLFDEYPHMKDIYLRRKNEEGASWDRSGRGTVVLGDTSKPGYNTPANGGKYGAVTHELYHAKASKEGWPQGTSVDMGEHKVTQDMLRFIKSKKGTPEKEVGDQLFFKNNEGSALGFARYQAEMGEALARREALMREFTPELLPGHGLANKSYLDMPLDTLFHPGEIATPDRYKRLMQLVDDRAVAADMMSKKGDVTFKKDKR